MQFGYVRVSSKDQNEDRQLVAMHDAGIPEKNVYTDKLSGKNFDRPEYLQLKKKLKTGDVLFVKSIDRLGRNYDEILRQWQEITKAIGADIVVLDMPLLDTRSKKDLTGTLISDIVLQLLSYVAQTEREFIRQRQREGIAVAQAKGVHFGRKPSVRPEGYEACKALWQAGLLSARGAGQILMVHHSTFLRWIQADESTPEQLHSEEISS